MCPLLCPSIVKQILRELWRSCKKENANLERFHYLLQSEIWSEGGSIGDVMNKVEEVEVAVRKQNKLPLPSMRQK